jgi:hypothetical protein
VKAYIESEAKSDLEAFCARYGLVVEVMRHAEFLGGYSAHLAHDGVSGEVMENGFLVGMAGHTRNNDPMEAVVDMCEWISHKRMAFHSGNYRGVRFEIEVPRLIPPKTLENAGEPPSVSPPPSPESGATA